MTTPRTLNNPTDIANYPTDQAVYRSGTLVKGGQRIIEAAWNGTQDHPAEKVSFTEDGDGWIKSDALAMGDVPVSEYVQPMPGEALQRRAMLRLRAKRLAQKGKHAEANYLLSTVGE